ncbi:uncharacterized protein SPSK_00621 [Sporothrix schenckii 1099-18]|uniref:Uncharacterized protein n=1 Tax=Sporothrix schenckii 1099-18 TaxID=1397361 RepID=A0A0F2LU01_SPOSC|nr:uncharacterized protein SPSK_00621 [Sporothrix schenckii 1099-18]KJR79985.1 hypothetical protein SPSK_00621 [Sporothrix schenckii 1099-18]
MTERVKVVRTVFKRKKATKTIGGEENENEDTKGDEKRRREKQNQAGEEYRRAKGSGETRATNPVKQHDCFDEAYPREGGHEAAADGNRELACDRVCTRNDEQTERGMKGKDEVARETKISKKRKEQMDTRWNRGNM